MSTTDLVLSGAPRAVTYRVESATRVVAGGQRLECHEVVEAEVVLLGREATGFVFRLRTEPPRIQANNGVFAWAHDVNAFLRDLVVLVDPRGRIAEVLNHAELLSKWPVHRQVLEQEYGQQPHAAGMLAYLDAAVHEPGFLASRIVGNGLYDFLFPGLYGAYPPAGLLTRKVLPNLFGSIDLPLVLTASLAELRVDGSSVLRLEGELDEAALDAPAFRRFLKDVADRHDVKADLVADYESTCRLDERHWLAESELFLAVQAGGTAYSYTLARHLTTQP